MRYQVNARILAHEQVGECEYELALESPEIAREAHAGQFVQVLYGNTLNPFSRRPFSVYRVEPERGVFHMVYLARGTFTRGLAERRVGDVLSLVGPLGNSYEADENPDAHHILVAGGVGAPPMYLLAWELLRFGMPEKRVTVINGARNRGLLVGLRELGELGVDLRVTTDDGSAGNRGLVTDALDTALNEAGSAARVYTCGPTPMLRAVGGMCVDRGIPCQLSVETAMPCGVGVCMGCVVKIRSTEDPAGFVYKRSCYDGPVFRAEDILWD